MGVGFDGITIVTIVTIPINGDAGPKVRAVNRSARKKNGFAPKICVTCGRSFEWRRKWAKDWDNVKYCSERCRRG